MMQQARVVGSFILLACVAYSQEPSTAFEVATVKASKATGGMNNRRDPMMATWTNMPLAVVIREAYHILPGQLMGGPAWINSDRWDIVAKTDRPASRAEQQRMLQPLLADRFHLKVKWDVRQLPEYELLVASSGPKVPASSGDGSVRIGKGLIAANGISGAVFAAWLRSELGRPVIDSTGLKGKYDFNLQWVPDESQPNSGGEQPPSDSTGPTIFAALQELGFKLKAIKGPVQVLVVEHAEKPSEN